MVGTTTVVCTTGQCGTGGYSGPQPGDPSSVLNLTATPTFGGVTLSWDYPGINPHAVAHTILYRGGGPNFDGATKHAVVDGSSYFDKIDYEVPVSYYYWIQAISIAGTVGDIVGPVTATARPLIERIIAALSGNIDASVLANELQAEIGKITTLGNSITGEVQQRLADFNALGNALTAQQQDVAAALAIAESTQSKQLSDYAALVSALNLYAAATDSSIAGVAQEVVVQTNAHNALASQVSTVETAINGNVATGQVGLLTNVTTIGNKVTAIGALYTAKVNVNGLIGGFGVYNSGTEVAAGFDVDSFWIGRTGADRKKPFLIQNGEVFIDEAIINQLSANKIDSRGLTIRAPDGRVILDAGGTGPSLVWSDVGGTNKPQDGATRNVFLGPWVSGSNYLVGDIVLSGDSSWSCTVAHTATGVNMPPGGGAAGNTWWSMFSSKGADALTGLLSNEAASIITADDGTIDATALQAQSGGTFSLYVGTVLIDYAGITFSVVSAVNCAGTINAFGGYYLTALTGTNAALTLRAAYNGAHVDKVLSVTKSIPAVNYDVELESSNGTIFRVGQATNTTIKARVYRNATEVTDSIPASAFKWTRVSMNPREPPYDDATWNNLYQQGYKQISVGVDDVHARATFFCQIFI